VGGGAAASVLGRHADLSAEDSGTSGDGTQVVARLNPASRAQAGEELELWLDARTIQLFDPDTGLSLRRPLKKEAQQEAAATPSADPQQAEARGTAVDPPADPPEAQATEGGPDPADAPSPPAGAPSG
jgi:hypothetical protein